MAAQVIQPTALVLQTQELGAKNEGNSFNDANSIGGWPATLAIDQRNPITELRVQNGWVIDGLSITYRLNDGSTKQVTHGTSSPINEAVIKLKPTEIVLAIFGRAGQHQYYKRETVSQISFVILDQAVPSVRVEGPFGNRDNSNQGNVFRVTGPIYALAGRANDGSDALGLKALSFLKGATFENPV